MIAAIICNIKGIPITIKRSNPKSSHKDKCKRNVINDDIKENIH